MLQLTDTVLLQRFALKHQIERNDLNKLYESGEIHLEGHLTKGESGRHEWWVTPEQHRAIIAYHQQHGLDYRSCDLCASEQTTLSN